MTNYTDEEIKPCPFCGSNASINDAEWGGYVIHCENEKCGVVISNDGSEENLKPVIDAWNKRPTEKQLLSQRDKLKITLSNAVHHVQQENKRLREALEEIANLGHLEGCDGNAPLYECDCALKMDLHADIAKQALDGS